MGSHKNGAHINRGRYKKRKLPQRWNTQHESGEGSSTSTASHEDTATVVIDGARIVNIEQLGKYVNELSSHVARCKENNGVIAFLGEKRDGLASILSTECGCGHKINLETSRKIKGPSGYHRWEINLAAVWGQMATGGGHSTLQETMAYCGVPVMAKKSFTKAERSIGEWWRDCLQQSMEEAGKRERELAIERGDYHNGVPAITVITDGGWSKRSHRHSYNAKSGVGIIIGLETRKVLHLSVRNKYCAGCATGSPREEHDCYKNWGSSSSAMETSAIVEGFQKAEKVHGVRYTRFIGDGDSSVYPTLLQEVPEWGRAITKMECANHACKCYRSSLEALVQNKPHYKGKGGLTLKMRKRLTSAARCAIKMRSKEVDRRKGVKLLEQDLRNGPYHCFGIHDRCSSDFCKHKVDQSMTPAALAGDNSEDDKTDYPETDDVEGIRQMKYSRSRYH